MDPKKMTRPLTILAKDNAIRLLEECCAEFILDEDFAIGPQFEYREINVEKAQGFICYLTLPLPGPFRGISSDLSPTKEAAKESIAFMACTMLVELGRLSNVVVPIEIRDDDSDDEDEEEEAHHDFILIDSDDDNIIDVLDITDAQTPDTIDVSEMFTHGHVYPHAHPIRSLHPSLLDTQSFYLYAVSRASDWKKGLRDTCILTTRKLDILPEGGSHTVALLEFARQVRVFPNALALSPSQHRLLGRFTQSILENIWMWDPNRMAKVDYLVAPIDLTTDPAVEKVINWDDMNIQDTMEMQDFRKYLDRTGFLDSVTFVPSMMEALVEMSKAKELKAANRKATITKVFPKKRILVNQQMRIYRATVAGQFQKCLRATHLYVDNPYWTAHDLTVAIGGRAIPSTKLEFLGTVLEESGLDSAVRAYRTLLPQVKTFSCWSDLGENHAVSLSEYGDSKGTHPAETTQFPGRERLESAFGYNFKHPWLYWHARHDGRRFQRLEFLGDAVLDYVMFEHYHQMYPTTFPHLVMSLKTECVRNRTLSALALSWGLHMDGVRSPAHDAVVDEAIKEIQRMESLSPTRQLEGKYWMKLGLPKTLADQTEALLGGIYADSGFSMELMFRVIRDMVAPFMDRYVLPSFVHILGESKSQISMQMSSLSSLQVTNLPCPKPLPAGSVLVPAKPTASNKVKSLLGPKKGGIQKKSHSAVQASVIRTADVPGGKMKTADPSDPSEPHPRPVDAKGLVVSLEKSSRRRKSRAERLSRKANGGVGVGLANMLHSSQGAVSFMTPRCTTAEIFMDSDDEQEDNTSRAGQWCLSQENYTQGVRARQQSASRSALAPGPVVGTQQSFSVSASKATTSGMYIPLGAGTGPVVEPQQPFSAFTSEPTTTYIPLGAATGPESSMIASGPTMEPSSSNVFSKSFLWAGSKPSSSLSLLATATADFSNWRPSTTPAPAANHHPAYSSNSSPSRAGPATVTLGQVFPMGQGQGQGQGRGRGRGRVLAAGNPVNTPWRQHFETKPTTTPFWPAASGGAFGSPLPTTDIFGTAKISSMDSGSTLGVGSDKCSSTDMASGFGSGLASPASPGFSVPFSYGMPSKPISTNSAFEKVVPLTIENTLLDKDEDVIME